jgi:glycolate oxidase iron-sulfur subunit
MQTRFTETQLADPAVANSDGVIRNCVHCGFCTATCPTYLLLGDERDSPRGRIYLIKDMLETEAKPSAEVVTHIDRCLSCLACMTTCPSGVNYMHLVDHGRAYIERHYRRPWPDRFWRWLLASVLPYPARFRAALRLGRLARGLAPLLGRVTHLRPAAAMLALSPGSIPAAPAIAQPAGLARHVVLLQGCAEHALAPSIRAATVRLLNRAGWRVVFAPGEGCCGALVHHMGKEAASHAAAARNVEIWARALAAGAEAILTTVSGCGTVMKNYGFTFRNDPRLAESARQVSDRVMDITQFLDQHGLPPVTLGAERPSVAYHAACSLQHGQRVTGAPRRLLAESGFDVRDVPEGHICCGSAGTYNILQPELAGRLRTRKQANIDATGADIVATGNIGCISQLRHDGDRPVVHLVELLDWATGGPRPAGVGTT